ncbi:amidohydrolase family protein [Streptomyces adustus]|uniref:amidohydrolase family protein n=1 Tax=Streptomyces adustus TaxID=1609272 RepID=UPI001391D4F5
MQVKPVVRPRPCLPYNIWRIDNRLRLAATPPELRHPVSEYFRRNFSITTSGHFCTPSLLAAIALLGDDRVMFSVDYPFEDMAQAAIWFDGLDLPDGQWRSIAHDNAVVLLGLRDLLPAIPAGRGAASGLSSR